MISYRIASEDSRSDVDEEIVQHIIDKLLGYDQLSIEHKQGHVFSGMKEGKVNFKPSYKFTPNNSTYTAEEGMFCLLYILYILYVFYCYSTHL